MAVVMVTAAIVDREVGFALTQAGKVVRDIGPEDKTRSDWYDDVGQYWLFDVCGKNIIIMIRFLLFACFAMAQIQFSR